MRSIVLIVKGTNILIVIIKIIVLIDAINVTTTIKPILNRYISVNVIVIMK